MSLYAIVQLYASARLFARDAVHQSTFGHDVLDEFRERVSLVCLAFCLVCDHACVKVDRYLVACVDPFARFRALQDRQSDVDGVSVEDPRKCLRDDAVYTSP